MAPSLYEREPLSRQANSSSGAYPESAGVKLIPGFYVPTVAFFEGESEAIDLSTTRSHAIRLVNAGVTGLVTHGSNGEAVHLSHDERMQINKATREAMDSVGRSDMPLIVGCGAQSTRETIQLCKEASQSGGQFTLVLPPSYYGGLLTTDMIIQHYQDVADASPIPIIIYNFPSACSGLDLNSETIIALSQHKNIVGAKLTCGNTGKLARVAAGASAPFLTLGGSADFVLQTHVVGGHGIIGGLANVSPRACLRVMELQNAGKTAEAQRIQHIVARGDWVAIKGGFVAVKVALQAYYRYGGLPRRPCMVPGREGVEKMTLELAELMKLESSLESSV